MCANCLKWAKGDIFTKTINAGYLIPKCWILSNNQFIYHIGGEGLSLRTPPAP